MAKISYHLRLVLVIGLVATCTAPAFAQLQRASRSLYLGSVLNVTVADQTDTDGPVAPLPALSGSEPLILDLTLFPDGFAYGRLLLPLRGIAVAGSGTLQQGSDLRLVFNEPGNTLSAWRPQLAHEATNSVTEGASTAPPRSPVVASFSGRRETGFTDEGRTITGAVALTSESGTVLNAHMQRFAVYSTWEFNQGRIHAAVTSPYLYRNGEALNEQLESGARERLEKFVTEGRGYAAGGVLGWAWELEEYLTVEGLAGSYVSLLNSIYSYTGGAHPNTFYTSYLYELRPSGVSEIKVDSLFRADSNWLARLTPLILSDLERQEASWVTQGQVTELTAVDLSTFTLGPTGLTFHFAPYAMGPYVQGAFAVTVEYGQLLGLAPAGGPLELFARGAAFN